MMSALFAGVDLTKCKDAVDDLTAYVAGVTRIGEPSTTAVE
jgi:hypothetical protein